MALSYRFNKKEYIYILSRLGSINSLYQGFGFIYMDNTDCREAVCSLVEKGVITASGKELYIDRGMKLILESIYSAEVVISDENINFWVYWNKDIIVIVSYDEICPCDYIITPLCTTDDLLNILSEKYQQNRFILYTDHLKNISLSNLEHYLRERSETR